MACDSIATTRVDVASIELTHDQMLQLLTLLTKQPASNGYSGVSWDNRQYAEIDRGDVQVQLTQSVVDGKAQIKMRVVGQSQSAVDKATKELTPLYDKLLITAQQSAVVTRLKQLGKLSQVKEINGGVTLRLELTV